MVIGFTPSEPGIAMPQFIEPPVAAAAVVSSEIAPSAVCTSAPPPPSPPLESEPPPHAATIAEIEASDRPSTVPRWMKWRREILPLANDSTRSSCSGSALRRNGSSWLKSVMRGSLLVVSTACPQSRGHAVLSQTVCRSQYPYGAAYHDMGGFRGAQASPAAAAASRGRSSTSITRMRAPSTSRTVKR